MKISDYPQIIELQDNQSFLVSGQNGTKRIVTRDLITFLLNKLYLPMGPGGVPYGKELTESWASLNSRIVQGDVSGINIGDFKPFTMTTGEVVVMEVAGIDQYYMCGDQEIGHHVDFISRDCLKGPRKFNATGTNNGNATDKNPWKASNLFKAFDTEVWATLPDDLKRYIIEKRAHLETRFSEVGPLNNSGGWAWNNMGKLWIPTEREVLGSAVWGDQSWTGGGGCNTQYPIFIGGAKHIIKGNGNSGPRVNWWVATARQDSSSDLCLVSCYGAASYYGAAYTEAYAPLGFRIGNDKVA